jgi:hypothetical protein
MTQSSHRPERLQYGPIAVMQCKPPSLNRACEIL